MESIVFEQNVSRLAVLSERADSRGEAARLLAQIYPLVPHFNADTFLPGYVVRRILQSKAVEASSDGARWRLADWASAGIVDYIAALAETPSDEKSRALANGFLRANLGLKAARVLQDLLLGLRETSPLQELIFRLLYFAGKDIDAVAAWVAEAKPERDAACRVEAEAQSTETGDPEAIAEVRRVRIADDCQMVEQLLDLELCSENPEWELKNLHRAGIRPPGATTRILDQIRLGKMQMWDALTEPGFYQEHIPKHVRESSRMSELILNTTPQKQLRFVPENTERLRAYVGAALRNLARGEYEAAAYEVAFEKERVEPEDDELADSLSPQIRNEWLLDVLILGRQEKVTEMFRRVEIMFHQDFPDLVRTYEVCFHEMPSASLTRQASVLETAVATVKRRKGDIRNYFARHLRSEGIDTGHYESRLRSVRLENLYQLVEKHLTGTISIPRGPERRSRLVEVINSVYQKKPAAFDLLKEAYLDDDLTPGEIARRRGVRTVDLEGMLHDLKVDLARRLKRTDRRIAVRLLRLLRSFRAERLELFPTFSLVYLADPRLRMREVAQLLGITEVTLLTKLRPIRSYFQEPLDAFGLTLDYYRLYFPSRLVGSLYEQVEEILSREVGLARGADSYRKELFAAMGSIAGEELNALLGELDGAGCHMEEFPSSLARRTAELFVQRTDRGTRQTGVAR